MPRNFLTLFFLAFFSLWQVSACAPEALASNYKLHVIHKGPRAGGGGGSVNASITMFTTEARKLDAQMATALSGASDSELITVSQTGNIDCKVWPDQPLTWGTWRKRELTDEFICETNGAAVGTQSGTLTITSSQGTYLLGVNVSAADRTTYAFGARSWPRIGGVPFATLASGFSTGTTTITNVTDNTGADRTGESDPLFEIYNGHLTVGCSGGTTNCPTATTSGTPIVRANHDPCEYFPTNWPTTPTGTWHVTLHNSVSGNNVTFDLVMTANQIDISPAPSWVTTNNTNGGPSYLYAEIEYLTGATNSTTRCKRYFGDSAVYEGYKSAPSTYNASTSVGSSWFAGMAGVGPSSIAAPIQPYDAGFFHHYPREPFQAIVNRITLRLDGTTSSGVDETVTYGGVGYPHHAVFQRFSEFDLSAADSDGSNQGTIGTNISTQGIMGAYLQVDHNKAPFFNLGGNNPRWNMFITDNKMNYKGPIPFFISGFGGVVDGNTVIAGYPTMLRGDVADMAMVQEPGSSVVARFNFNHFKDMVEAPDPCTGHTDLLQFITSDNAYMVAHLTGAPQQGFQIIGNTFTMSNLVGYNSNTQATDCTGRPVNTTGTKFASVPQNIFLSGTPDTTKIDFQIVGNTLETGTVWGISATGWGDNSVIRYNLGHFPYYVEDCTHGGLCLTPLQFAATDNYIHVYGPSGVPDIDHNAFNFTPTSTANNVTGLSGPTLTLGANEVTSLSSASFVNPWTVTTHTIQDILDRNRLVTNTSGPTADLTKVDVRGRTYDPAVLTPSTTRHSPYCSTPPVATKSWSTSPVNGSTVTITTPGVYGNSPTSTIGDNWTLYDANLLEIVNKGSGTTVTLNNADVARVGTSNKPVSIYYTQGKSNTDGGGQCVSNVVQLSP